MKIDKYVASLGDFSNMKIAITGCTSGVGLELFHHLAKGHAKLVLLALEDDTAQKLKEQYPEEEIDIIHYDQSSYQLIEEAVNELLKRHKDIDVVALNAGVLGLNGVTKDGYPKTIGINYFGTKHFIDYVSPKIKKNIKFVIQGSFVAGFKLKKNVNLLDPKIEKFDQYNISKIYLEAYFYKLYKENKYPNIEYVLTEPGLTGTGITTNLNAVYRKGGKYFLKWFFHSPKKASLTLLIGISSKAKNGDFIIPRGGFGLSGYPKIKTFPRKRRRLELLE